MRPLLTLLVPLLALLLTVSPALTVRMGKNVEFQLNGMATQTFESDPERELNDNEVLKVQLHPMGRKDARPTPQTLVWLWISERDERHHWVLPWQPGGGPAQQWLEVLLCQNQQSLELMAETNATYPMPMRWRVSTENVKLGDGGTMKSTLADVSYRRFRWEDPAARAVDLEVRVVTGAEVCASLAVARRCVTHPHELTDSHLLQRVMFASGARFSVSRADAPDGFWLYLIPEMDPSKCAATAHQRTSNLPPPAKTIRVTKQTRNYELTGPTPRPLVDGELPFGAPVPAVGEDGDWAGPPPVSECQRKLDECRQQCPHA